MAKSSDMAQGGIGRAALVAGLAFAAAWVAITAFPGDASARGRCPAPYLVHAASEFDSQEVRRARHNVFQVHQRNLKLRPPVRWTRDPYNSRRFRGALNTLAWLDVLFYDFRENGRRQSLRRARDLALDWIRSNPPGSDRTDRTWDDRISATRATYLAYAMRASDCRGILNGRKKRAFTRAIFHHGQLASSSKHYRATNHGLFVDTNLIMLSRAAPNLAKGRGWARTGKRRFGRTLRGRIVEKEGFWLEHSASYQMAIRREVAFFRKLTRGNALEVLLNRMTNVAGWLVQPNGRLTLLGSTNRMRIPKPIKQEAANDEGLKWLGRSGLAFVKRSGGYLSLAATFFNGSHKDSDDLSFDLYDSGRRLITDSGEYDKDERAFGRFSDSPAAHSTLIVDGQGFPRDGRYAYKSGLVARGVGDGWFALAARNPLARRQGVGHQRLLLYRPGLGLIVADRVRSEHRHTYRRFFQLAPTLTAKREFGHVTLSQGGWTGRLDDETRRGDPAMALHRGRRRPSILGFEFPRFRQRLSRPTAVMRTTGADLDHLAVLDASGSQSLEARLIRANPKRTDVALEIDGAPAGTLSAERHRHRLRVRVEP